MQQEYVIDKDYPFGFGLDSSDEDTVETDCISLKNTIYADRKREIDSNVHLHSIQTKKIKLEDNRETCPSLVSSNYTSHGAANHSGDSDTDVSTDTELNIEKHSSLSGDTCSEVGDFSNQEITDKEPVEFSLKTVRLPSTPLTANLCGDDNSRSENHVPTKKVYSRSYYDLPSLDDDKENVPNLFLRYPKPPSAPELPHFMITEVSEVLKKSDDEIIVTGFTITIKRSHLALYENLGWLEDTTIDIYLSMIKDRNSKKNSKYPSVYIFFSFFFKLLMNSGYDAVKLTTDTENIFDFDLVLFPIHYMDHWRLVSVNFEEKAIICFDSMIHESDNEMILVEICKYLRKEYRKVRRDKLLIERGNGSVSPALSTSSIESSSHDDGIQSYLPSKRNFFNSDEWTVHTASSCEIPQQQNGCDCGVFCLQFAEYLSRRAGFDFTQKHMPYFRKRMMYETITKTLLIQ